MFSYSFSSSSLVDLYLTSQVLSFLFFTKKIMHFFIGTSFSLKLKKKKNCYYSKLLVLDLLQSWWNSWISYLKLTICGYNHVKRDSMSILNYVWMKNTGGSSQVIFIKFSLIILLVITSEVYRGLHSLQAIMKVLKSNRKRGFPLL